MIQMACPGCGKKLHAKDELAGRKAKCPQCGQPITIPEPSNTIPLDDVEPGEYIIPASEERLAPPPKIERLNRESHYMICDKNRLMATWANNGAGWMVRAGQGFLPAKRAKDKLPESGEFQLTELKFTMTPEGKRLAGIVSYQLVPRWALTVLDQGDDNITEKISAPGHLNKDQKLAVRQALKEQFMRPVWQDATAVLEYLSSVDYHTQGVEQ